MSNRFYNDGLERAAVRDLSGAMNSLRQSLKFNKNNIDARNLLGLIYFETGEVVEALGQWVISKNLRPNKNIADDYINLLQTSQARLDGFNQALKLAEGLGKELSIPVVDGLVRLRKTKTQTKLNQLEREANVRGAFKVRDEISFKGMTVMLVDDVVTTGSTLRACEKEVLKAGADEVIWVTAARASEEKKKKG